MISKIQIDHLQKLVNNHGKSKSQTYFFFSFLCIILGSLLNVNIHATSVSSSNIYCPEKIICQKNNDLNSCSFSSKDTPYWKKITYVSFPQRVVVGEYIFSGATSPYHASFVLISENLTDNIPGCRYRNGQETLGILSQTEPSIEAKKTISSKWVLNRFDSPQARCWGGTPEECPFKEAESLAVFNGLDTPIIASIDNSQIQISYNPIGTGYRMIRYEDVIPCCYDENICKIDLSTSTDGDIGSVYVDTKNKMKIIKINYVDDSMIDILPNSPYNSIRVLKSSNNAPFISIINEINSNIKATVNGKVALDVGAGATQIIRFNRLLQICNKETKCTINLGVQSTGSNTGLVTIDMRGNLQIIKTESKNPSQIIVEQKDNNSVLVDYAEHRDDNKSGR